MTMEVYESMTQQDYQSDLPGYYENSTCATEYGGVRRQKHARSPVLNIQPGEILKVSSRRFARGRWVVGTFNADNRLYVFVCSVVLNTTEGANSVNQLWVMVVWSSSVRFFIFV